jgi:hypothetical protein
MSDAKLLSAHAAGATAERKRVASILTSAAAKGREDLAQHLALRTDLAVPAALAALEAAPLSQSLEHYEYERGAAYARKLLGK